MTGETYTYDWIRKEQKAKAMQRACLTRRWKTSSLKHRTFSVYHIFGEECAQEVLTAADWFESATL